MKWWHSVSNSLPAPASLRPAHLHLQPPFCQPLQDGGHALHQDGGLMLQVAAPEDAMHGHVLDQQQVGSNLGEKEGWRQPVATWLRVTLAGHHGINALCATDFRCVAGCDPKLCGVLDAVCCDSSNMPLWPLWQQGTACGDRLRTVNVQFAPSGWSLLRSQRPGTELPMGLLPSTPRQTAPHPQGQTRRQRLDTGRGSRAHMTRYDVVNRQDVPAHMRYRAHMTRCDMMYRHT